MPRLARLAFAVGAALVLVSSSAIAMIDVVGNSTTFAWEPSSGPVSLYLVYVNRNGAGFGETFANAVSQPRATVTGAIGDTVRVRVAAWAWDSRTQSSITSELSPISPEVRFVDTVGADPDSASTRPPPE
jgi:hypothetical protein